MKMRSAREKVEDRIKQSPENIVGHGAHFQRRSWLGHVSFSDVMDAVLYMIDLHGKRDLITRIDTYEFWDKVVERLWQEKAESVFGAAWGWRRSEYPLGSGNFSRFDKWLELNSAWHGGSGPMGGTMGDAEHYALLHPGFRQHKFLIQFFQYPKGLPWQAGNWPVYKKSHIEETVFPKLRRKEHAKKLVCILNFAEEVCSTLNEAAYKRAK